MSDLEFICFLSLMDLIPIGFWIVVGLLLVVLFLALNWIPISNRVRKYLGLEERNIENENCALDFQFQICRSSGRRTRSRSRSAFVFTGARPLSLTTACTSGTGTVKATSTSDSDDDSEAEQFPRRLNTGPRPRQGLRDESVDSFPNNARRTHSSSGPGQLQSQFEEINLAQSMEINTASASNSQKQDDSNEDLSNFRCHVCDETVSISDIEVHISTHTGGKQYKCSETGRDKYFAEKRLLNSHLEEHFEKKPYQCSFCDKSYSHSQTLKAHVRLHTGENVLECSEPGCGQRFAREGHFDRHLQKHSNDRPFGCDLCEKSYKYRDSLNSHLATHRNEKFICSECGNSYCQKTSLSRHMRENHKENRN